MKRYTLTLTILTATLLMVTSVAATARTEVISGSCPDSVGGSWIILLTVDDTTGRVTHREGISCGGHHWVDHCSLIPASWVPTGVSTCSNDLPDRHSDACGTPCEPYDPDLC